MNRKPNIKLRRGWTTGACATAATRAALMALWGDGFPKSVRINLPKGVGAEFEIAHKLKSGAWAETGIIKDAGDDPDVTHQAMIIARVEPSNGGLFFKAGKGVGIVTKPGLPIGVGEAAINPVPRQMMTETVVEMAARLGQAPDITITISVPNGEELAQKTWNPRLGIVGGLSILGTTGIVRPFSCSAWIASIHRGIDVARASHTRHVAGCTGATSERSVQGHYDLPDHAMLDMGDFAGGLLKYLARHPVERLTIGGGLGKLAKLAQGARDLHSGRSQVDFSGLSAALGRPEIATANTVLEAYEIVGQPLADYIAKGALETVQSMLPASVVADIIVIDRAGTIVANTAQEGKPKRTGL